jgi:glycosyltransferase involved in cell wall biosynthesis
VWKLLNKLNPAVIHALLWSACALVRLYSRLCGVPSVCAIHSPFNANADNSTVRTLYDRLTASWATVTVFVSRAVMEQALIAAAVPARKRVLIFNGIACEDIFAHAASSPKTRQQYGLSQEHFVIGTVGRLVPVKNQKLLLLLVARVRERYPRVRLMIVGGGPLRTELEQQVREYGLDSHVCIVRGLGVEHYPLFDCFVQPSFTEGLSIALLEAIVCRVPVVAASTGDGHDVIVHGVTGFLCKPHDLDRLEQILVDTIEDRELCKRVATSARQLVCEYYTVERMVAGYKNLMDVIAKK